ncbi:MULTISPECIES: hypothetical protein [unclassified Mesorhizobium]|uniref:hypothetical protein n=1 Tax=unclassified Mesorhizobium TaxID=325217 RepID=UPI001FE0B826|nr:MULTISPECIES: hypothetical protein [unclassified Mesorhizobium]
MDRPAMASVFRMRHAPATVSGVRSTGQGQADPIIRVHSLGEAIRFVAHAYPNYDISTVAIDCGDPRSRASAASRSRRCGANMASA